MLRSDTLMQLLNLKLVLFLEFLKGKIGSGLIITHIVVPSIAKFQELATLGRLYCKQLLLLCLSHILELPEHFFVAEVVKFQLGSSCLR